MIRKNTWLGCLIICGGLFLQPIWTSATMMSCSRFIRNVTFNANSTFNIFNSPSYPNTYPASLNCTYLFKGPDGHRIELAFRTFQMEGASSKCTSKDYIEVRDGPNGKSPLIGRFCGTLEPKPIISSGISLYMFFVSNDKFVFQGFTGTYRVVSEVQIAKCTKQTNSASLFSHGYLTSPEFPAKYPPNRKCSWTLQAAPGYFMRLTFDDVFQTQCPNDKVIIRDQEQNGQLLGEFCGEEKPRVFHGRKLWVHFKSDDSFILKENGFNASYEALPFKGHISDHCTGGGGRKVIRVNGSTPGTIKTPWMPDFYPNNILCIWKIRAPKGERVKLTFSLFQLERPCDSDFIEINDEAVKRNNPRENFCGKYPDTVSAAEDVEVRFFSGAKERRKGFVMHYSVNKGTRADYSNGRLLRLYAVLLFSAYHGIR